MLYNEIKHIIKQFKYEGVYKEAYELQSGNINSTYRLTYVADDVERSYVLQKINRVAFRDPIGLMDNIIRVTKHIETKLDKNNPDFSRRHLCFVETFDGSYLYCDDVGNYWRSYVYVNDVTAYDSIKDPHLFYEAGKGFGEFQRQLFDFPAAQLNETILNFHNTKRRFYDFVAAVAEDKANRVHGIEAEIDFLFDRRKMMGEIVDKLDAGVLPIRVTHNDTKLNNVLIDNTTGKAICVIDLDTVMPGSSLYDYGDAIRYGACTAAEDEEDTSKISIDMELFKLFTKGFIEEISGVLEKEEMRYLPLGIKVITCELAMRFLTDYINGDEYFKTKSPDHNLIRARAQMKLLTEIEAKYDEMVKYVESWI